MSLNFVSVLIAILIGRWSEESLCSVVQVVCLCRVLWIMVMSGDVFCCSLVFGVLVGVLVFSVIWVEFVIMFSRSSPLWSLVGEYHRSEWALKSPPMMALSRVVRYVMQFVMSLSSVMWFGFVVFLGGMYMLVM